MQNNYDPVQSSLLVAPAAIVVWFICCVCAAFFGYMELSIFFGFICALTLCSFFWGRFSLRKLEYEITISQKGVFPGQEIEISRTLKNNKFLPLIWLELLEPCDSGGCAMPDKKFIIQDELPSGDGTVLRHRCFYKFSLLKWHQSLTFNDTWKAMRRGIHIIDNVTLRSGDGFGLCAQSKIFKVATAGQITVYPRQVDVSIEKILSEMWDTRSDSYGYLEDVTLVKSVRDYLPSDPARRMNWRLLAKGQGFKVNIYETVEPDSILFIVDAASFNKHAGDLEHALSITSSLITGLSVRGIHVGLLTPPSDYFEQECVFPSGHETNLTRMLELLAAMKFSDPPLQRFDYPDLVGRVYYIAHSLESAVSLETLKSFPEDKAQILAYEPGISSFHYIRVRDLKGFGREL